MTNHILERAIRQAQPQPLTWNENERLKTLMKIRAHLERNPELKKHFPGLYRGRK